MRTPFTQALQPSSLFPPCPLQVSGLLPSRIWAQAQAQQTQIIEESQKQAQQIINQAKDTASKQANEILEKTKQEAEVLLTKTQSELELQRAQMLKEAKKDITDLVLLTSEKILDKKVDDQTDRDFVNGLVGTLKTTKSA